LDPTGQGRQLEDADTYQSPVSRAVRRARSPIERTGHGFGEGQAQQFQTAVRGQLLRTELEIDLLGLVKIDPGLAVVESWQLSGQHEER
jgi:hypothetical protein